MQGGGGAVHIEERTVSIDEQTIHIDDFTLTVNDATIEVDGAPSLSRTRRALSAM